MEELNALVSKRGQIKAALTRFRNYIKSDDCDINQIPHRRKKIEETWDMFERVQSKIEDLDKDSNTDHYLYRTEYENVYFETITEAEQLTNVTKVAGEEKTNEPGEDVSQRNSYREDSIGSAASIIKLAALNIPVFNGDYSD